MKRIWISTLFLLALLTACSIDPRKLAEADVLRMEARSQAAFAAQQLRQAGDEQSLALEEQRLTQAVRLAARERLILWTSVSGALALSLVIAWAGYTAARTLDGLGRVLVAYAGLRADVLGNLVPLDARTRQFPLLLHRLGDGRYSLSNPNTESVLILDMKRLADRQMVSAAGAVQFVGAFSQEAKRANDPAGMALIRTPMAEQE